MTHYWLVYEIKATQMTVSRPKSKESNWYLQ